MEAKVIEAPRKTTEELANACVSDSKHDLTSPFALCSLWVLHNLSGLPNSLQAQAAALALLNESLLVHSPKDTKPSHPKHE